jgi:hypothetical protein
MQTKAWTTALTRYESLANFRYYKLARVPSVKRENSPEIVGVTWIKQQNVRAANLLRFLAYLDHQDIWYKFLHGGQGGDQ